MDDLLCCASRNSLFFLIIGVSLSGMGTTLSVLVPPASINPYPLIDLRVFRTKPVPGGGGGIDDPPGVLGARRGGDSGRGADGRGREDDAPAEDEAYGSARSPISLRLVF